VLDRSIQTDGENGPSKNGDLLSACQRAFLTDDPLTQERREDQMFETLKGNRAALRLRLKDRALQRRNQEAGETRRSRSCVTGRRFSQPLSNNTRPTGASPHIFQ
jgi:hypothetical protein